MPLQNAPRLHLNENLSPRLASELREYGFNVIASQETDMLTASDEEQLAFAAAERRAIVTFNVGDFTILHYEYQAEGKEHWGIILSSPEHIGVILRRLLHLLNSVSAEELRNQIRWLNDFR
jgi:predicted nuclease of predicted toxin-antitoxin system